MPDFSDQLNMSEPYRLSPVKGVPKSKSAAPPMGGPRIESSGAGGYDLGPAPSSAAPKMRPQPAARPPAQPKYNSGDDLVSAYQKMTSGFRPDTSMAIHTPSPGVAASVGSADTFLPGAVQAAHQVGEMAAINETPLMRGLNRVGNWQIPQFPRPNPATLASAGVGAMAMGAAADPQGSVNAAVHPMQTLQGIAQNVTNPQGTWAPAFGEGMYRLMNDQVSPMELGSAAGQGLGMQAALKGGMNMGQTLHRYGSNFGQGNLGRDLGAGLNVIKNKLSDAWHDPGGGFGR